MCERNSAREDSIRRRGGFKDSFTRRSPFGGTEETPGDSESKEQKDKFNSITFFPNSSKIKVSFNDSSSVHTSTRQNAPSNAVNDSRIFTIEVLKYSLSLFDSVFISRAPNLLTNASQTLIFRVTALFNPPYWRTE